MDFLKKELEMMWSTLNYLKSYFSASDALEKSILGVSIVNSSKKEEKELGYMIKDFSSACGLMFDLCFSPC